MSSAQLRSANSEGISGSLLLAAFAGLLLTVLPAEGVALLAIGVTSFAVAMLRPDVFPAAIFWGVALLPSYVGVVAPGLGYVNVLRAVMYLGALGAVLFLLRTARVGREYAGSWRALFHAAPHPLLLLGAGWALAIALAPANGVGNVIRAANMVLYQALPFAAAALYIRSDDHVARLAVVAGGALLYVAVFTAIDVFTGRSVFSGYVPPLPGLLEGGELMRRNGMVRAEATLGQPLGLAQFALIALPLSAGLVRQHRLRLLGIGCAAVGVFVLWATHTRSTSIALGGGILLLLLAPRWRQAGVVILVLLILALLVPPLRAKLNISQAVEEGAAKLSMTTYSAETEAEFSSAARVFVVAAGVKAIAGRPLLGYGVHGSSSGAGLPTVDNYFVLLPLDIGLPAAVLIFSGMFAVWITLAATRRSTTWDKVLLLAAAAYLVELLFVGLEDTLPLLFLTLGAIWARRPLRADDAEPDARKVAA